MRTNVGEGETNCYVEGEDWNVARWTVRGQVYWFKEGMQGGNHAHHKK